jgi:hypothetical protein
MAERNYLTEGRPASASAHGPERSAEEIRRDIASTRESITETVDQLSDRFGQTLDWRTHVADRPLIALAVAAGIGFLAAGLFKRRSSAKDRITDALADAVEDMTDRFRNQLDGLGLKRPGLGMTMRAAAAGAIAKAATAYLSNRVVGGDTYNNHKYE